MVLGKLDGILDILCTLLFNYDLEVWKVQAPRSGTSSLNSNTRQGYKTEPLTLKMQSVR